jgi:hypothetical protein
MEVEYATKGKANAALTTGIIGTVGTGLALLSGLGSLFGDKNCKSSDEKNNAPITRYDQSLNDRITAVMTENALLRANIYNDQKSLEMYQYVDGRLRVIESQICQQNVVNAQVTANISCMQNAINTLSGLTKTVIPIDSVCPEPMQRYNSWTAPTATTTTGA